MLLQILEILQVFTNFENFAGFYKFCKFCRCVRSGQSQLSWREPALLPSHHLLFFLRKPLGDGYHSQIFNHSFLETVIILIVIKSFHSHSLFQVLLACFLLLSSSLLLVFSLLRIPESLPAWLVPCLQFQNSCIFICI